MKKFLTIVVVLFGVFYLLTQPASAADAVRNVMDAVGSAFESVITFLNRLFQ